MGRDASVVVSAELYVKQLVTAAADGQNRQVAQVRDLATAAGVSRSTMLKALRRLADEGLVQTRRGKGVVMGPASGAPVYPAIPLMPLASRHENVATALEDDIIHGEFARGEPLPIAKVLAARYGVSTPTLRLAARSLLTKGVLTTDRRRVLPARQSAASHQSSILFAIPGRPNQVATQHDFRHEENVNAMERVCSRLGLVARRLNVFTDDTGARAISPSLEECTHPEILEGCLGMCINQRGINRDDLHSLLTFATRHKLSVAILDESNWLSDLPLTYPHTRLRVYAMGNTLSPGEQVGRLLGALGHRRVLCVAPSDDPLWSQRRIEGLLRGLRASAASVSLIRATVDPLPQDRRDSHARRAQEISADLLSTVGAGGWRYAETPDAIRDVLTKADEGAWLQHQIAPTLADWREHQTATAVVGANDALALACLGVFWSEGIRVPGEVSVVGFDDTPEAARSGLTSYTFDSLSAAQAMVNFVLEPLRGPYPSRSRRRVVETRGRISIRLSTARAPA
jgi:DNA-binding GntR family transcriptional regulator